MGRRAVCTHYVAHPPTPPCTTHTIYLFLAQGGVLRLTVSRAFDRFSCIWPSRVHLAGRQRIDSACCSGFLHALGQRADFSPRGCNLDSKIQHAVFANLDIRLKAYCISAYIIVYPMGYYCPYRGRRVHTEKRPLPTKIRTVFIAMIQENTDSLQGCNTDPTGRGARG
jgi:hypothetical protein